MSIFPILLTIGVLMISSAQAVTYLTSEPYNGKKYLLSNGLEVFDLAKMNARCKGSGGYLVDIDNSSEQNWLEYFVSYEAGGHVVYTGITDEGSEGHYYHYNTKKPAKYLGWKWRQPDNWKGKEHCVNIAYNGLNDIDCGRKAKYICEVPA
ncbi:mannose-binding protein c [Plakobranchus ocellatus]|uniref:Mannose-binding protein c n=1 Tax=Plakobranchus ocellatus TaxID=259542 RepID=A0AAV4A515_9GAST|nr:mannose-binding protein c [Plakobranchus ocellatus]